MQGRGARKNPVAGIEQPTLIVNRIADKQLNVTFPKNALASATFIDRPRADRGHGKSETSFTAIAVMSLRASVDPNFILH